MSDKRVTVDDMAGLVEAMADDAQISDGNIMPCGFCLYKGRCHYRHKGDDPCPVYSAVMRRLRGKRKERT